MAHPEGRRGSPPSPIAHANRAHRYVGSRSSAIWPEGLADRLAVPADATLTRRRRSKA